MVKVKSFTNQIREFKAHKRRGEDNMTEERGRAPATETRDYFGTCFIHTSRERWGV